MKHFLFGIKNCFVELKCLAHSYPKLKKMSSAHYADEQNIKIRCNNNDSNPPSSTDKENENDSIIDAEMLCWTSLHSFEKGEIPFAFINTSKKTWIFIDGSHQKSNCCWTWHKQYDWWYVWKKFFWILKLFDTVVLKHLSNEILILLNWKQTVPLSMNMVFFLYVY